MISPAVKFLRKPIDAVAQNLQSSGHPTCVETQRVNRCRFTSSSSSSSGLSNAARGGMRTLSIRFPSLSSKRSLVVPSWGEVCVSMSESESIEARVGSFSRKVFESVVISAKVDDSLAYNQSNNCLPRYFCSPIEIANASNSLSVNPLRFC